MEIVKFPVKEEDPLENIPGMLRKMADEIDKGEKLPIAITLIGENEDNTFSIYSLGRFVSVMHTVGILEIAKMCLIQGE